MKGLKKRGARFVIKKLFESGLQDLDGNSIFLMKDIYYPLSRYVIPRSGAMRNLRVVSQ